MAPMWRNDEPEDDEPLWQHSELGDRFRSTTHLIFLDEQGHTQHCLLHGTVDTEWICERRAELREAWHVMLASLGCELVSITVRHERRQELIEDFQQTLTRGLDDELEERRRKRIRLAETVAAVRRVDIDLDELQRQGGTGSGG